MSTTQRKQLSHKDFDAIVASHKEWLQNHSKGKCARFENVKISFKFENIDLTQAVFDNVSMRYVCVENVKFDCAEFTDCDLEGSSFENCTFKHTDLGMNKLSNADFTDCDLTDACVQSTNFQEVYFINVNFTNVDANGTDFRNADFDNCKFENMRYDECTAGFALACPETGAFTAYKKARLYNRDNCIVQLEVPADALRSSATTRKCRVSKAKVVAVYDENGKSIQKNAYSNHTKSFVYRIGQMIEVKNFDKDRWHECAPGIHCFITKKEAELYW